VLGQGRHLVAKLELSVRLDMEEHTLKQLGVLGPRNLRDLYPLSL